MSRSRGRGVGCAAITKRKYSFANAASFEVMRARRLREALAFDNDFTADGYVELRPLRLGNAQNT